MDYYDFFELIVDFVCCIDLFYGFGECIECLVGCRFGFGQVYMCFVYGFMIFGVC